MIECNETGCEEDVCEYKVQFSGSNGVGKTSIIDQFSRSEHDDVYSRDYVVQIADEENHVARYATNWEY